MSWAGPVSGATGQQRTVRRAHGARYGGYGDSGSVRRAHVAMGSDTPRARRALWRYGDSGSVRRAHVAMGSDTPRARRALWRYGGSGSARRALRMAWRSALGADLGAGRCWFGRSKASCLALAAPDILTRDVKVLCV